MKPCPLADASGILFRDTEYVCATKRLAAMQLRFEPVLKRSRKRRPRALETAELAGIGPVDAAQFLLDRGKIDSQAAAFADERASVHNHLAHQRCVASRKQKFDRIDRHDPVA